ncbi:MAG: CRTAC1 family protein [Elusimicrobia bacterium]|nr:CRTAC1 family protein [Elusimicrobiota bacterium]
MRRESLAALVLAGLCAGCRRTPPVPAEPAVFEEVARAAGVRFRHFPGTRSSLLPEDMGSGVCFADADGDGLDDLYFVNAAPLDAARREAGADAENALFLNKGGGAFVRVPGAAGAAGRGTGMGCLFADFTGAGRRDLFVTSFEGDLFYRNEGGGRFAEAGRAAGLADRRWGAGACAADFDGDGRLDLDVPRYVEFDAARAPRLPAMDRGGYNVPVTLSPHAFPPLGNSLYRNEGGGRMRDVSRAAGAAAPDRKGMQCLFADFDEDGRQDLFVADDVTPDLLLRNRGGGAFADATFEAWLGDVKSSMGAALGDFDGDGDLDLAVTQWIAHEKSLYINLLRERAAKDKPGRRLHFADGNAPAGLGETTLDNVGWGAAFLDYDNDGRLDLILANGSTFEERGRPEKLIGQTLQLFLNRDDGTFADVSARAGPAFRLPLNARGLAGADYDGDGRQDVAVNVHGGEALLLRNALRNGNHWLELRLRGREGASDAIGARARVTTPDGTVQTRVVSAGGSYLSQHSFTLHFGLGGADRASKIEVLWPSGRKLVLTEQAVDRLLVVEESR